MVDCVVVVGADGSWVGWTLGNLAMYLAGLEFTKNCMTDCGIWRGLRTIFLLSVDNKSINALLASLNGEINSLASWGASELQKL